MALKADQKAKMVGFQATGAENTVAKRLEIGRRISEYISKSHNARVRYNAYDCFVKLIENNRKDFASVWKHRMNVPRKKRDGEEFLNSLRARAVPTKKESEKLALRLLWLLEEMDEQNAGANPKGERSWALL